RRARDRGGRRGRRGRGRRGRRGRRRKLRRLGVSARAYLVVGLGNPGPTYALTRHNVGFLAVDEVASRAHATFTSAARHRAHLASVVLPAAPGIDAVPLRLAKPTTYMNESGVAVGALAAFHKIPPEQVVVIHDELDLDPGQLR